MNEQQCLDCSHNDCLCPSCNGFLYVDGCVQKECPIDSDLCTSFDGSEVFKGVLS